MKIFQLLAGLPAASATTLFVASYAGTITSLSLTEYGGNYSLKELSVSTECAPNPSWLTLDANRGLLFCLNEGLATVNGSLSSFTINSNGSLTHVQNTTTISGPVSGIIYGEPAGQRAIALAHYGPTAAVSSFLLNGGGKFSYNQNITFTLSQPGAVPDRQAGPHEHEAITDPTGQYILVPDLGADLVRVFRFDRSTLRLQELNPLKTAPGDGPRHAVFYNPYGVACENCTTFLYVANELAATVKGYSVSYVADAGGLEFREVFSSSTYGNLTQPQGIAPSEIHVSPDNRFLLVGNRNDSVSTVPNPDTSNSTRVPTDTISTFQLNRSGRPSFSQLAPSYGLFPRHFSTNAVGNLIAIGNQRSGNVVILERDVVSGQIGEVVARVDIEGEITNVLFNEEYALGRLGV